MSGMFRALPSGIGIASIPERVLLKVDTGFCDMLGYHEAELIGNNASMLYVTDEDYVAVAQAIYPQIEEKGIGSVESRLKRRDGKIIDVLLSSTPLLQDDGSRVVVFTALDISETKRHEAIIQLQARRAEVLLNLPLAAERMDEAAFMHHGLDMAEDLTGSRISFIHFVNEDQQSIELVTWSRRTIDEYCDVAFDTHYPVRQAGIWADALRQRKPVVFNDYNACPHRCALPEGHAALRRLISVPVIEGTRVVMITGVGNKAEDYSAFDIETMRLISSEIWRVVRLRRNITLLGANEARLRTLINTLPDLVWLKDPDGVYLACNPMFERYFGAKEAEIVGKTDYDFIDGEMADFFRNQDRAAMAADMPVVNEETVTFADGGHSNILETLKTRMFSADGKLVGVLGIARDITERKRSEAELASQLDELRRWQDVTIGREIRALELKREVNELCRKLNLPPRYASVETENARDV